MDLEGFSHHSNTVLCGEKDQGNPSRLCLIPKLTGCGARGNALIINKLDFRNRKCNSTLLLGCIWRYG